LSHYCKSDGTTTSLHPEMVNLCNNHFSRIFTSEDDFVPVPQTDSSLSIIDTLVITPQIVLTKLNNLESGKSPGPDGWPTELIKCRAESICFP